MLTATTRQDGKGLIRTTAMVADHIAVVGRGQLRYLTTVDGHHINGLYPFVAGMADGWEVTNAEFLDPSHSICALRRAGPLKVTWGIYSPAAAFCCPGGGAPDSAELRRCSHGHLGPARRRAMWPCGMV